MKVKHKKRILSGAIIGLLIVSGFCFGMAFNASQPVERIQVGHGTTIIEDNKVTTPELTVDNITPKTDNVRIENLDPISAMLAIQKYTGRFFFINNFFSGVMIESTGETGAITWGADADYVEMVTGATIDSKAEVYKTIWGGSWSKKRHLHAMFELDVVTSQVFVLTTGGITTDAASPYEIIEAQTRRHVGVKVVNNSLYGTVADGSTESTLLLGTIAADTTTRIRIDYIPGVEARFYLDEVDKGTITTNLPSGTTDASTFLDVGISNTETADKTAYLIDAKVLEEP